MEKLSNPKRIGLALCLALGAASCSEPNQTGVGNEFKVLGKVTDPGSQSLKAEVVRVDQANGETDDWFDIGEVEQFHDNCECHGFWDGRKQYGHAYDYEGTEISPSEIEEGACVYLQGTAREEVESAGKTTYREYRLVYHEARVTPCG